MSPKLPDGAKEKEDQSDLEMLCRSDWRFCCRVCHCGERSLRPPHIRARYLGRHWRVWRYAGKHGINLRNIMNGATIHRQVSSSVAPLIWAIRGLTVCGWLFIFAAAALMTWMGKPDHLSVELSWLVGFGLQVTAIVVRVYREFRSQSYRNTGAANQPGSDSSIG